MNQNKKTSFSLVSVQKLKANKRNPRKHSASQIQMLKESIEKFGFLNPIIIDEKMNVIAGHGRLSAARELGMKDVPAITAPKLNQKQKDALMIADNKISAESYWDNELLAEILEELDGEEDIFTGFTDKEIGDLLLEIESQTSPGTSGDSETITLGDAEQEKVSSMIDKADQYASNAMRNIVVILGEEEYVKMSQALRYLMSHGKFQNNSDVIFYYITNAAQKLGLEEAGS